MNVIKICVIVLVFLLFFGVIGGIIWFFIDEDLKTKAYIKFHIELDKLEYKESDFDG